MVTAVASLEPARRMVTRIDCADACACVGVYVGMFNILVQSSCTISYCNMHKLKSVLHCRFGTLWEGDNYKTILN